MTNELRFRPVGDVEMAAAERLSKDRHLTSTRQSERRSSAGVAIDPAGRFSLLGGRSRKIDHVPTPLTQLAGAYLDERRRAISDMLDYLILVPTLRCNLACSYCQVSRASENAAGYDWDERTLDSVVRLISNLRASSIKIEFQGGEPSLRPDLIRAVIDAVPEEVDASFVVCTNLQNIDDEILELFDRDDVSISTSLDGPSDVHTRQRGPQEISGKFAANLEYVVKRYGPEKVSALPTIDPLSPPEPQELVEAFAGQGLNSIYLRPINYQGFARKNHAESLHISKTWSAYQRRFIEYLIDYNWKHEAWVEETYFSMLLRRIFRPGSDRHVDLRNPNPVGRDYIVIDYDGNAYPSDEARMLTRSGVIDLSIGDVHEGWDGDRRATLDAASTLDGDPVCEACAYKPYCGRDIVDDISRYGTIDVPREETEFCKRHMALFDYAFELIGSEDEKVRHSLGRWLDLPGPMPDMRLTQ